MQIAWTCCLALSFFFTLLFSLSTICRKTIPKNKKTKTNSDKQMVGIRRMSEESGSFYPDIMQGGEAAEDDFSMAQQYTFHHQQNDNPEEEEGAVVVEMEQWNNNQTEHNIVQENDEGNHILPYQDHSNWNIGSSYHQEQENGHQHGNYYPPTSDLLNMFPLPSCTTSTDMLQTPSISFANSAQKFNLLTSLGLIGGLADSDGTVAPAAVYDPLLPLNLPPHPPMLDDLFHTLPHGYYNTLGGNSRSGSLFSGVDNDGDAIIGDLYQDSDGRPLTNGVFEFTSVGEKDGRKNTKPFATEKQRRVHLNDRYAALRSLVPNPSKSDRASVVGDAICYIEELKRRVNELKFLVDKKRCTREITNRAKIEIGVEIKEPKSENIDDQPYNRPSALRSSWLNRKSKNTEVDVRIIDDEVTVKLVQQKRVNCLLIVSKVLDDLQLDLFHVAGGLIGDYYSFLFNSKICEGSTLYAHAIANKLNDVVDSNFPTNT